MDAQEANLDRASAAGCVQRAILILRHDTTRDVNATMVAEHLDGGTVQEDREVFELLGTSLGSSLVSRESQPPRFISGKNALLEGGILE